MTKQLTKTLKYLHFGMMCGIIDSERGVGSFQFKSIQVKHSIKKEEA